LNWIDQSGVLAKKSLWICAPNPRVGCVLISDVQTSLGQGYTQAVGSPHAEIMALRDAVSKGYGITGATAYVTLEPCSHYGRTPPCCDALIAAGIQKVVVAIADPNPLVAGQGLERLRASGIEVEVLPTDSAAAVASRELNIGFFSRMIRKTPWVRLKLAASLDGTTALDNGSSQWITSPAARADGHLWRARSCAVLTGVGTVLSDNPRLDVRGVDTPRQPHVVVVDSDLQTPPDAQIFIASRAVFICSRAQNGVDYANRKASLQARGATVIELPSDALTGKVDLAAMLLELGRREINELHVEAGYKLNGSLVRAGLVDEFVVYLAPKLLGVGLGMARFGPLAELSQAVSLTFTSTEMIGSDLRVLARVSGRDLF
jgi:diaminohydroxyphosphoribosylaminopyrimidine deaminase / 5-amino-6-(5-phosphoribosylamino)uracil reductase